jgi:hypothetical protein
MRPFCEGDVTEPLALATATTSGPSLHKHSAIRLIYITGTSHTMASTRGLVFLVMAALARDVFSYVPHGAACQTSATQSLPFCDVKLSVVPGSHHDQWISMMHTLIALTLFALLCG